MCGPGAHIHDRDTGPVRAIAGVRHLLGIAAGTVGRLHIGFEDGAQPAWGQLLTLQNAIFIGDQLCPVGQPAFLDQRQGHLPAELVQCQPFIQCILQAATNVLQNVLAQDARDRKRRGVRPGLHVMPVKADGIAL
jgi:hypothetical protein